MTRLAPWLLPLILAGGCVSQAELNQAVSDDVRFTSRIMGFALDADREALETRLALLRAFDGDPHQEVLVRHLGTAAEVEAKLDRVRAAQRELIAASQRLQRRYGPDAIEEEPPAPKPAPQPEPEPQPEPNPKPEGSRDAPR